MNIHFLTFIALDLFAACSIQDECVASVTFFHLSSLCISAALIGTTDDKHPSGLVLLLSSCHLPSAPQVSVRVCDCREKAMAAAMMLLDKLA
jgi:hypothetical protein